MLNRLRHTSGSILNRQNGSSANIISWTLGECLVRVRGFDKVCAEIRPLTRSSLDPDLRDISSWSATPGWQVLIKFLQEDCGRVFGEEIDGSCG